MTTSPYGKFVLIDETGKVEAAAQGTRNQTLNRAAFNVFQLVAGGEIDHDEAWSALHAAGLSIGLTPAEVERTMRSALNGGRANPRAAPPAKTTENIPAHIPPSIDQITGTAPTEAPPVDEETFWKARPLLTHIRAFARARQASPWAVLGVVLARAACAVEPYVVLPALVGTYASINTYIALVGPSGGGKDAAIGAAVDAVDMGHIPTIGVGSGQGIGHLFARYRKPDPKSGEPGGIELHASRYLLEATEVDTLAGLVAQRGSSTLLAELRRAWNGGPLGFAYVDREKRLSIPAHRYRLGLVVGVQPERAAVLLDPSARASGTPQRFLWMPAEDPGAPDHPPLTPYWEPDGVPVFAKPYPALDARATATPLRHTERVELAVCDQAVATIRENRLARLRGTGDALDGHALLCRLKVAAVLSLLRTIDHDMTPEVDDEDWSLAGDIQTVSDATRLSVTRALGDAAKRDNRARGAADAERSDTAGERLEEEALKRVCRWIVNRLVTQHGTDVVVRGDLRGALPSRDRNYFDTAVYRLQDVGRVAVVQRDEDTGKVLRCRLT